MVRARTLMMVTLVLIATLSVPMLSKMGNVSVRGLKANESIHTDKSIYVLGEDIIIYIHGDANTLYDVYVNNHFYNNVRTNGTGDYIDSISTYDWRINLGTNKIELRSFTTGDVLATTYIEVRKGLTFWPSKYTHTTAEYASGEILWVKLEGENNKEYRMNITDSSGNVVYPRMGYNVSVTTDENGVVIFNVTLNMGDGDYSMNLYNGTKYIQSRDFSIRSVEISVEIDKSVYLLSEKIHGFVTVYWLKTHAPIKDATYRWWIINASNPNEEYGPYFEEKSSFYSYPLNQYVNATGKKIGVNQKYILKVEYNMTNSTGLHYGAQEIYFYTGYLRADVNNIAIDGTFSPGKRVKTDIKTYVKCPSYLRESVLGNVTIEYINMSATDHWETLWYKNYTSPGKTDIAGDFSIIWTVPHLDIGTKIDVSARVVVGDESYIAHGYLYIQSGASSTIKLNKEPIESVWSSGRLVYAYRYLAGENAIIKVITSLPSNVQVTNYEYQVYSGDRLLYYQSTNESEIVYQIPRNFSGEMHIYETTYFSTGETYTDEAIIYVDYGIIYLQASKNYFKNPGEKIDIYVEFRSNVMHPHNYTVEIMDDHNREVRKTTIPFKSTTNYTFTVPSYDSDIYTIRVEASDGSYYTSNKIVIGRFVGYELSARIVTKSKFENGIYEPGETIKISYSITKYGEFESHDLILYWEIAGTDYVWSQRITDLNGTVTFTIPKDIYGSRIIEMWLVDSENHLAWNMIGIDIEKGSWSMQSIAGMPMGTFLNLLLVIIALVLVVFALFLLFRGRRGEYPRKRAPQPFEPQPQQEGKVAERQEKEVPEREEGVGGFEEFES